ncbi:hypothetical protein Hamer_G005113 [Homarus americanus]|uniref:Uncharacterized protein n=1 Tax=Homarus americanus TaxID=6706 RepID=A0A8J5K167_HOMAM|nr:hypothetical protein Hamer_G005113 [Homarus americanus]
MLTSQLAVVCSPRRQQTILARVDSCAPDVCGAHSFCHATKRNSKLRKTKLKNSQGCCGTVLLINHEMKL